MRKVFERITNSRAAVFSRSASVNEDQTTLEADDVISELFHLARADERARLDNFSIWLKGEAKRMADSAKHYLTKQQHVSANRIFVIDGGFRDTAEYELFLIPTDMPPPAPTPTLAPNQVKIVGKR